MASSSNRMLCHLQWEYIVWCSHLSQCLSYIFRLPCRSFYSSTCCFTLYFYIMKTVSFLTSHEPASVVRCLLCAELQRLCFALGLGLRKYCGGFICCSDHWNLLHRSNDTVCTLIIPVFTGNSPLISFKNFSFVYTTWLTVRSKRPS